ncbi:MAG: trypsin-like peptidase domain-containing protein [Candidatus Dependentiae bacterium]|nr:trypsin-like peptidase domain-containing protein [Candidatus Dependentiae bacterium]
MKKENIVLIKGTVDWTQIQDAVQNAVVQVFAQVGKFNWLEPYNIEEQAENRGSGFLINGDGYIITNAHVIDEAKRIWVHVPLLGRHMIHVDVVGCCPQRDVALLRIKPKDLKELRAALGVVPYLIFGDSDVVQRTDAILVLGYPMGQYRLKSTTGVVSGRESSDGGQAFIQVTAPINPGSSGGPMFNEHGQVIGISIATIAEAQNVGYAIPINQLSLILDELYTQRLVRVPFLGVQCMYANDSKAEFLGNPLPAGIYINRVIKDSLFDRAGIQVGDMLYEFNGLPIDVYGESPAPWGVDKTTLIDLIARVKTGDKVKCVVYRNGKRKEITLKFVLSDPYPIRHMYPDCEAIDYEIIAGMVIMPLADNHIPLLIEDAPDLVVYEKVEEKLQPVLVIAHVLPGSLAQQLNVIMPGDSIKEVNGIEVGTLESFRKALQKSITTGFLTLKTRRDFFAAFNLQDLLDDELQLSKDFMYPVTKAVEKLLKKVNKTAV